MNQINESESSGLPALTLVEIIGSLPEGAPKTWLSEGVKSWLAGARLEQALGLEGGQGRRTARSKYRRHLRDEALRCAHAMMPGASPWRRTLALVPEVRKFAAILWPRWRALDAPPLEASALRKALFAAFQNGEPPASATGLHGICNPQGMGSFP